MAAALRLFHDDDAPEPNWHTSKLRTIFNLWFLPQVLSNRRRRKRPITTATLKQYRDAIGWWEGITGDPNAEDITDETLDRFVEGLDTARYRRGPVSIDRRLSEATREKHKTQIRAILSRIHHGAEKPRLEILAEPIELPSFALDSMPKPTPDFDEFKQIVDHLQHCALKLKLCSPPNIEPVHFWRALLATLYCHGWRLQTALLLDWSMYAPGKVNRIRLPAEANLKTHKSAIRPVPDWLLQHWRRQNIRFRTGEWPIPTSGPILGGPLTVKTLDRSFKRLQKAARPGAKPYSLQSLRRLHGASIVDAGYKLAQEMSRESLQHASSKTTANFYAGVLEKAIFLLPEV